MCKIGNIKISIRGMFEFERVQKEFQLSDDVGSVSSNRIINFDFKNLFLFLTSNLQFFPAVQQKQLTDVSTIHLFDVCEFVISQCKRSASIVSSRLSRLIEGSVSVAFNSCGRTRAECVNSS